MYEINRNEHLEQNASKITEMVSSTLPQESTSKEITIGYNDIAAIDIVIIACLQ